MENRGFRDFSSGWGRLKLLAGLTVMAFAVTLAVIVGNRLSDEALGVLAGAVCGVGAAIPTSLLVVAVSRRRGESRDAGPFGHATQSPHAGPYPPVVVITPPTGQQRPDAWSGLPPALSGPGQRRFTVVGGEPFDASEIL